MKTKPVSKTKPQAKPPSEDQKRGAELDDAELGKISGGGTGGAGARKIKFHEFSIQ